MPRPTKGGPRRALIGGFSHFILSTTCLSDGSGSSKCLSQSDIPSFIMKLSTVSGQKDKQAQQQVPLQTRCKDAQEKSTASLSQATRLPSY